LKIPEKVAILLCNNPLINTLIPMKTKFSFSLLVLSFFILIPFACRKSVSTYNTTQTNTQGATDTTHHSVDSTKSNQTIPFPQTGITGCSYAPDYGDTLLFPQPTNGPDYIISPINNPGPGKYFSWPMGMVIDSTTGAINLTKSETGEKFVIGFVKEGTTDTCLTTLILAGAAYMDSVYVLADGETKALPYFNANPNSVLVCNGSGVSGSGCAFDVTNDASSKRIVVDNNTGVIDLKKTLNGGGLFGGAFGLLPVNGQTVTTDLYYQLNDGSNMAMQHISVQLMYYSNKSQIGAGLLSTLVLKLDNILTGNLITTSGNPRPPLIIITRFN